MPESYSDTSAEPQHYQRQREQSTAKSRRCAYPTEPPADGVEYPSSSPPNQFPRRPFLRRTAGFAAVVIGSGIAGCAGGQDALDDVAGDDGPESPATDSDLALQPGLQIGLGSTAFAGLAGPGEVDPDEPGGGRLLTIESVEPASSVTVSWRRTVERERTPETPVTAGVGEDTPTPEVEIVEESGTVTATGLAGAHKAYLPMYWRPKDITTDSSAIWLSAEAFQELRESRQTAWSPDVLTRISRLSEDAVQRIEEGVAEVDQVLLKAKEEFADFELAVDGTTSTVQAIQAFDTFGNAYSILDDEANPLILEFTYDAVSTGFAGIDAGLWSLIKTVFSGYRIVSLSTP